MTVMMKIVHLRSSIYYKIERDIGIDTQTGYTINLYPTSNRLLINDKDLDRFMANHLPEVHRIICTPFRSGRFRVPVS